MVKREEKSGKIYDLTNNYLIKLKALLDKDEHVPAGMTVKQHISKDLNYITHVEIESGIDPKCVTYQVGVRGTNYSDQVTIHSPDRVKP